MSIPKLKVYRLDEGYSQLYDNDIQSLSKDQLLPFSPKKLNPLDVEPMIGIKEHRQSRMVVESDWKIRFLDMNREKFSNNSSVMETVFFDCEGIVLGEGNFRVFVKKQKLDSSSSSSSDSSSSNNDLFSICNQQNGWYQLDKKFWDYNIQSVVKYYDKNYDEVSDLKNGSIQHIHLINQMQFKFGDLLTQTKLFFQSGYNTDNMYVKIVSPYDDINTIAENRIIIMYKQFQELYSSDKNFLLDQTVFKLSDIKEVDVGSVKNEESCYRHIAASHSRYRVPFGNIYNGNKIGRCFYYNKINGNETVFECDTYIPDNVVLNNNNAHCYEGNYMYKKKVMPLRYLVAQSENYSSSSSENYSSSSSENYSSSFIRDTLINESGSCLFAADYDWCIDGLMKPVVMERLKIKDESGNERYIFKKLEQNIQIRMNYEDNSNQINNRLDYRVSFLDSFYDVNGTRIYPKEIFLFYNKVDDSLGNIFDFNYDYNMFANIDGYSLKSNAWEDIITGYDDDKKPIKNNLIREYGYSNNGRLISGLSSDKYNILFKKEDGVNYIYKKNEILVVREGFGYDKNRDLLLQYDETQNVLSFTMLLSFDNNKQCYYNNHFTNQLGSKIYINGIKIWETGDSDSENYSINYKDKDDDQKPVNPTWKIKLSNITKIPNDLMLVFYEKYPIFNGENNSKFLGYRIPCYEKVKKSNLFVSSFPNWVKGHLNNDLDVFVGNQVYSGTTVDQNNIEAIYPSYKEDGWYAMYPEGSIQFANDVQEFNFFDIFNYGNYVSNSIIDFSSLKEDDIKKIMPDYLPKDGLDANLKLYYNKVKYNVAYYDGIYAVVRSKLSNYSIQNGGVHYALLEDDDFVSSVDKKWVLKDDNYIRLMYESGLNELPEKVSIANQEEASILDQFVTKSGTFLRLSTKTNRIQVVNYVPTYGSSVEGQYGDGFDNSMIVCLNYACEQSKTISLQDLTKDDLRVHVKVHDYKLWIGLQHKANCPFLGGGECTCNHGFFEELVENGNYFTLNNIEPEMVIKWYCLQPLQDSYVDEDIDNVQLIQEDVGEGNNNENAIFKRYKFSMEDWYYDVYFQVYSYRYQQEENSDDGKFPIYSVEYIVYKIDK